MHRARHRDVETALVVETRQRHLVEAVDVEDQIERLPNRQEIRKHEQLLRLLVALMTQTQRDDLSRLEECVRLEILHEPMRADLAEPCADGSTEHADDELI